jgi:hypothetical protein
MRRVGLLAVLVLSYGCGITEPAPIPISLPRAAITFQPGPEFPVIEGSRGQRTVLHIAEIRENPGNSPTPQLVQDLGLCSCGPNGEYTPSFESITLRTNVEYAIYAWDPVRSRLFMTQQTGDQFFVYGQRVERRTLLLTSSQDYHTNAAAFRIVGRKGTIE